MDGAAGLAELRAALEDDGFTVDDLDGAGLGIDFADDDDVSFYLALEVLDDGVGATLATESFELEPDELARVVHWFEDQGIDHEVQRDDDGVPGFVFWQGLPHPAAADVPAWVRDLADSLREVFEGLVAFGDGIDEEMEVLAEALDFYNTGRVREAIAELERVLVDLDPAETPRARGTALACLGDMYCAVGRNDEAMPLLERGLELLRAVGEERAAALTELSLITEDLDHGRTDDALLRCDRIAEVLARVGQADDLALVDTRRGQLLARLDRADEAIDLLAALERRLPPTSPHLGDARFALANALLAVHNNDAALDMLNAAEEIFAAQGKELDVALCRGNKVKALVELRDFDAAEIELAAARRILAGYDQPDRIAPLDIHETLLRRARGERPAAEPDDEDDILADSSAEDTHRELAEALLAFEANDFTTAIAKGERVAARFGELQMPVLQAQALHNLALARMTAIALSGEAEIDQAAAPLADIVAAVDVLEAHPQHFRSVADRGRWAASMGSVVALAFCLAHAVGRHGQAAELLERVRAQGLPDLDATAAGIGLGGGVASDSSGTVEAPTGDPLLDEVRRALQDLSVTAAPVGDVATATRVVGGPGAWRWTLWQASGFVLWTVREPTGRVHSGFVPVEGPRRDISTLPLFAQEFAAKMDDAGPVLQRLRDAQGVATDGVAKQEAVRAGFLVTDPDDREPDEAWELGRLLIPGVLAGQLRRRLRLGAPPLPLVIAPAPGLARLPYGLLALEPRSRTVPLGRRLVEAAVVTIAPPSGIVDAVAARPPAPGPRPVRFAVVDPTADLPHAASLVARRPDVAQPDGPLFGGATVQATAPAAQAPTKDAIVAAFRALTAGAPGVLLWAGHARPGEDGEPLDEGWLLPATDEAGARLRVKDLLLEGLHAPSRAVLSGCSTVGGIDELNEWWGLPVSVLFGGASAVLACAWDMIDSPAAADLAAELVGVARDADDLATALREVQLRSLREWAERRTVDRTFRSDETDRHPHLWAAWTVVGVHRG
jgi:tetratricopeptide (TPR) repeat protein